MNFSTFWTNLKALETGIEITSPVAMGVKNAHWGTPPKAVTDLPAFINTMTESERILGFGSREQRLRVPVQFLAAKATVEDPRSCEIATAFWFAAKDAFDRDTTIGGAVEFSTLKGLEPTVPVLLTHAGQAYFGFNAVLEILSFKGFTFEPEEEGE